MNQLPANRYRFDFEVQTPLHLNFYSGSMLRGAFGHALRKLSCMTRQKVCKSCPLYRSCPYPLLFETPPPVSHPLQSFSQIPNPYVIEPPPLGSRNYRPGETMRFSMVLIGRAIDQLPLVIFAWQRALAFGVGPAHGKAALRRVWYCPDGEEPVPVYAAGEGAAVSPHQSDPPKTVAASTDAICLAVETPLRIQKKGRIVSHDMTARDLLMALVRRYYLLQEFHTAAYQPPDFHGLAEAAAQIVCETRLKWCDWHRYSHRQQQKMALGGVLGRITLRGGLTPFLPLLHAGQWLHAGNKTTFGMGRYVLC